MDIKNKYTFYVGTARGAIAYTNCTQNETLKYKLPECASEITSLEWGKNDNEIVIGYKNGSVQLFDASQDKYTKTVTNTEGEGATIGALLIEDVLIVGRNNGVVNLWTKHSLDTFSLNLPEQGTLECLICNRDRLNIIATGGESNDLKLWDVESKSCLFKAKSLGHDELNLPILTSIRGICFINDQTCCVTKEGMVLLYDDRAQRRPIVRFREPKASYTTVTYAHREKQCLTGTTRGYMQLIDLRAPGKCLKTYKNFTGSVTGIVCDAAKPFVGTTSLDRHFRVHNIETKELVYKEYMKQNLTKVLMKPLIKDEPNEIIDKENSSEEDEEYEAMFENMEEINEEKTKKNKRKILSKEKTVKRKKVTAS